LGPQWPDTSTFAPDAATFCADWMPAPCAAVRFCVLSTSATPWDSVSKIRNFAALPKRVSSGAFRSLPDVENAIFMMALSSFSS